MKKFLFYLLIALIAVAFLAYVVMDMINTFEPRKKQQPPQIVEMVAEETIEETIEEPIKEIKPKQSFFDYLAEKYPDEYSYEKRKQKSDFIFQEIEKNLPEDVKNSKSPAYEVYRLNNDYIDWLFNQTDN